MIVAVVEYGLCCCSYEEGLMEEGVVMGKLVTGNGDCGTLKMETEDGGSTPKGNVECIRKKDKKK